MAEKQLNEQQKLFLELLFTPAIAGDVVKAKLAAGYSPNYPTSALTRLLQEDILEATRLFLARQGPKAAIKLVDTMDNPEQLGIKYVQAAAKDVLDRIGIVKTEKVEVGGQGIFFLPPKSDE